MLPRESVIIFLGTRSRLQSQPLWRLEDRVIGSYRRYLSEPGSNNSNPLSKVDTSMPSRVRNALSIDLRGGSRNDRSVASFGDSVRLVTVYFGRLTITQGRLASRAAMIVVDNPYTSCLARV